MNTSAYSDNLLIAKDFLYSFIVDIVKLLSGLMKQGGVLRIATDVPDYAMHVRHVMDSSPEWRLKNLVEHLPCVGGPSYRPVTRYEKKAVELSNWIWDYEYVYTG
jgi:tRNA G46 methylase TrmB